MKKNGSHPIAQILNRIVFCRVSLGFHVPVHEIGERSVWSTRQSDMLRWQKHWVLRVACRPSPFRLRDGRRWHLAGDGDLSTLRNDDRPMRREFRWLRSPKIREKIMQRGRGEVRLRTTLRRAMGKSDAYSEGSAVR